MIASELVSGIFSPLKTSETGEEALTTMHVYHVKHLPIVNNKQLLGTISEEDILTHDMDEAIGSYGLSLVRAYVKSDVHIFEIMAKMAEYKLTTIPVLDENDDYVGTITQEKLIQFYSETFSFKEPGGILVLEMHKRDYSLADISRIVESEGISILISFLTSDPDSQKIFVTLKLNTVDTQHVVATLQRHDYHIRARFTEETYFEDLKERYDSLMAYLNV